MDLKNEREVEVTREKIRLLESRYELVKKDDQGDAYLQELTMRSLKRNINQMKEEILRFEARRREQAKIKV